MNYTVKKIKGNYCVLKRLERSLRRRDKDNNNLELIPDPNYEGTGMALAGVLREDQTLEEWMQEHIETENARERAIYE